MFNDFEFTVFQEFSGGSQKAKYGSQEANYDIVLFWISAIVYYMKVTTLLEFIVVLSER